MDKIGRPQTHGPRAASTASLIYIVEKVTGGRGKKTQRGYLYQPPFGRPSNRHYQIRIPTAHMAVPGRELPGQRERDRLAPEHSNENTTLAPRPLAAVPGDAKESTVERPKGVGILPRRSRQPGPLRRPAASIQSWPK
jgi:hypothetical protein